MLRALRSEASTRDRKAAFRFVLIVYALFSLLDWMTTARALPQGGHEGNPIAALLYEQFGSAGLLLFKAIVVTVIIGVLALIPRRVMSQRVAVWVGTAFVVLTALAVIDNTQALSSLPHGAPQHQSIPDARLI